VAKPRIELSLHPSNWIKVRNLEFLGTAWTAFAGGCVKCSGVKRSEKSDRFFLVLPEKINQLRAELEINFELVFKADAEAAWREDEQRRKTEYEAIEFRIQKNNERLQQRTEPPYGLFPFQRLAIHWLSSRRAGLLALPTGVGKTPIGILTVPKGSCCLVVCPAVVKLKWAAEIVEWRCGIDDELKVIVHKSKESLKLNPKRDGSFTEFHILSYEMMPEMSTLESSLFWNRMPNKTFLIIDEAHYCKNMKNAIRAKKNKQLAQVVLNHGGRVYPFTSTPIDNQAMELWNVLSLGNLEVEAFGSFANYRRLFNAREGQYALEWGTPEPEVPELLGKVALIRKKAEILPDLPAKMPPQIITVDTQIKANKKFDVLWERFKNELKKGIDFAEVVRRCRQGRLDIPFEEYSTVLKEISRQKIPAMKEIVLEFLAQKEPLVVAAHHLEPLHKLKEMEEGEGPWGPNFPIIEGEMSAEEKHRVQEAFQAGMVPIIGISIKAAGVGINLFKASNMLFVDTHWSPAVNEQCADRIHRIGQQRVCFYKYLVANHPLDLKIHQTNLDKKAIVESTMYGEPRRRVLVTRAHIFRIAEKIHKGIATDVERLLFEEVCRRVRRTGSVPAR
jgi:SNF2 family DNA or RNA helicase